MLIMEKLKMILSMVRLLFAAKLGRCPLCMRMSARGTLAGWAVVFTVAFAWPNPIALTVASVIAFCFTLLAVTHFITYMFRVGLTLRALQDGEGPVRMPCVNDQGRRTFMLSIGKAGVAALLISLFGRRVAVWAQQGRTCTGEGVLLADEDGNNDGDHENSDPRAGALICSGDCPQGIVCTRQSSRNDHGGVREWCGCPGQPEPTDCHLVKITPGRGEGGGPPFFTCAGSCPQGKCTKVIKPFFGRFTVTCECK